jgi:3D (Asp-Asp-Asp) domain-containing protein
MVIETLVLGQLMLTAYRSVPQQTDDSPFITSIGHHTHPYGIAVSQDLLATGKVKYGDYLCVERLGCYVVNDTMNQRHTNSADIWVATYEQEKAIPPKLRKVVRIRGKNGH